MMPTTQIVHTPIWGLVSIFNRNIKMSYRNGCQNMTSSNQSCTSLYPAFIIKKFWTGTRFAITTLAISCREISDKTYIYISYLLTKLIFRDNNMAVNILVTGFETGLAKTQVLLVLPTPLGKTRVLLGFNRVKLGFTG